MNNEKLWIMNELHERMKRELWIMNELPRDVGTRIIFAIFKNRR